MRYVLPGALLLLLGALQSCDSGSARLTPNVHSVPIIELAAGKTAQLPGLPAADHFLPQRATAQADVQLPGNQTFAAANAGPGPGSSLVLTAPAQQVAYGLYHFIGVPGEAIRQVGVDGAALSPGGHVYAAISDYSMQRWTFFQDQTSAQFHTDVTAQSGKYVSPGGDTYVLVAVFGGDSLTVQNVSLQYENRFPVTGQVLDINGAPVAGATVSTPLFSQSVKTDISGNFTLPGLLNGSWPVVVTADGWTFYSNPQTVSVQMSSPAPMKFQGRQNGDNFEPRDGVEASDDDVSIARSVDIEAGPVPGSLSVIDDPYDYLKVTVSAPGNHYLRFENPTGDILFPTVEIDNDTISTYSYLAYSGCICVPLPGAGGPGTYIVKLSASGGGGKYTLSLQTGVLNELQGTVSDGGPLTTGNQLIRATTGGGQITTYITSSQEDGIRDAYREAVPTELLPIQKGFSFVPPSRTANLDVGPVLDADFIASLNVGPDSFEPNDSKSDADLHAALPLPYDSQATADALSINQATDKNDIYAFTPAAGKGLRVDVVPDQRSSTDGMVTLYLMNNVFDTVGTAVEGDDGSLEVRLPTPANGNPYYVVLTVTSTVAYGFSYSISAATGDIKQLTCHVDLGGNPTEGAQVQLRGGPGFAWSVNAVTDISGDTPPFPALADEVIDTELFRYGFEKSRTTKQVVMDADKTVKYSSSPAKSSDSLESNDTLMYPALITLPGTVHATLARDCDPADCYFFALSERKQIQVDLHTTLGGGNFQVELFDESWNQIQAQFFSPTETRQLFDPPGPGDYILRVDSSGIDSTYTLDLTTIVSYKVSGTVGPGVGYCLVHCAETGRTVGADPVTGNYYLGYLPPGSFTIEAAAPQHTPVPASQSIAISDADVTADFSLTAAPGDLGEPNDVRAQAFPITPDGVRTTGYSIGTGNDHDDWYSFTATAGESVTVSIDWSLPWFSDAFIFAVKDPVANTIASSYAHGQGGQQAQFIAPSTGTYTFEVDAGHVDYGITVTLTP